MRTILIFGGTAEAYQLADQLASVVSLNVITALAGRTQNPRLPPGKVRIGGFGGVEGIIDYLRKATIDQVIDATHPFADRISRNVAIATQKTHIPVLRLVRPAWQADAHDHWLSTDSLAEASHTVQRLAKTQGYHRCFLSIGHQDLAYFQDLDQIWCLMRTVDPLPPTQRYPRGNVIVQRGPFHLAQEQQLLQDHGIQVLVSKNSGGTATYAKILAARALKIPVVMVERPTSLTVPVVADVEDALTWLLSDAVPPIH